MGRSYVDDPDDGLIGPKERRVERWTRHALNDRSFAYVAEERRGYQALVPDEKIRFQEGQRHSGGQDILPMN